MITIAGTTLAGMASAARLARLGHDVQLGRCGIAALGGPWAPEYQDSLQVDALPQTFTIPALWRDLFTKTGRPLAGSAGQAGLDLVPAPGAEHRFADGSSFMLPTERGAQYYAISDRYGEAAAASWRDLLDRLTSVWQARRRFGVEGTEAPKKADHSSLGLGLILDALADRLGHEHLATIVRSWGPRSGTNSPTAPALLAVPLLLERTFDRWQLVDRDRRPVAASSMIELLVSRLEQLGVRIVDEVADPDLDARPVLSKTKLWQPTPQAALAPQISHRILDQPAPESVVEIVDHTQSAPVITWLRPSHQGTLASVHDYTRPRANLAWGLAPDRKANWLARVAVLGTPLRASTCSPAGNEAWAELASAALASYELHRRLTGQDPSPKNKSFRMPPKR